MSSAFIGEKLASGRELSKVKFLLLAATVVALSVAAQAHHSITGIYDRNNPVTIEGTVTEFRFVNPHPFVIVQVTRNGGSETWKLELDNRYELSDIGIKADTLKPGDRIMARGSRAHDGSPSMYTARIERRADGFWYEQVGSSPRTGRNR
jgi:hypothetical protein